MTAAQQTATLTGRKLIGYTPANSPLPTDWVQGCVSWWKETEWPETPATLAEILRNYLALRDNLPANVITPRNWFAEFDEKLRQMGRLARDWDSYGAEPPANCAIASARLACEVLHEIGFEPARIAPSAEGGVGICFLNGDKYADIECFNTGEILAVISDRRDRREVWSVAPNKRDIEEVLDRIRAFIDE